MTLFYHVYSYKSQARRANCNVQYNSKKKTKQKQNETKRNKVTCTTTKTKSPTRKQANTEKSANMDICHDMGEIYICYVPKQGAIIILKCILKPRVIEKCCERINKRCDIRRIKFKLKYGSLLQISVHSYNCICDENEAELHRSWSRYFSGAFRLHLPNFGIRSMLFQLGFCDVNAPMIRMVYWCELGDGWVSQLPTMNLSFARRVPLKHTRPLGIL